MLPTTFPVEALRTLKNFLLGSDRDVTKLLEALWLLVGFALNYEMNRVVQLFGSDQPEFTLEDVKLISDKLPEEMKATGIPPWVIPIIIRVLTRLLMKNEPVQST